MTEDFPPEDQTEDVRTSAEPVTENGESSENDVDLSAAVSELTSDLQRVQAEYVNYKRRVDRDRDVARQRGIESVIADLLPVLDGIAGAKA
ncbi:MAG: nucleotide exchange factor GrpE, partial [Actinobacteria bacterium]|nr:nucleotide exchange factor GrpE [Actinomycetota bacterium]